METIGVLLNIVPKKPRNLGYVAELTSFYYKNYEPISTFLVIKLMFYFERKKKKEKWKKASWPVGGVKTASPLFWTLGSYCLNAHSSNHLEPVIIFDVGFSWFFTCIFSLICNHRWYEYSAPPGPPPSSSFPLSSLGTLGNVSSL